MVQIFDQTNSGSSCLLTEHRLIVAVHLLTEHPNAMKITHLLQNKFYFVVLNKHCFKFIQANSQFIKSKEIRQALTVNDGIWKHCKNQARRLLSKICVQFDARKKHNQAVLSL